MSTPLTPPPLPLDPQMWVDIISLDDTDFQKRTSWGKFTSILPYYKYYLHMFDQRNYCPCRSFPEGNGTLNMRKSTFFSKWRMNKEDGWGWVKKNWKNCMFSLSINAQTNKSKKKNVHVCYNCNMYLFLSFTFFFCFSFAHFFLTQPSYPPLEPPGKYMYFIVQSSENVKDEVSSILEEI